MRGGKSLKPTNNQNRKKLDGREKFGRAYVVRKASQDDGERLGSPRLEEVIGEEGKGYPPCLRHHSVRPLST